MSYTVKYDAGEIQDNITTIDKPTIQIDSPRNSKGEITSTEIDLTFADPAVDGESATLIKNNLKLANLNRGAIVLDQDTTQNSITVDNLESSTAYQATLTQYAEEQIEAYSKVDFSTAQEAPFSISTDTVTLKQGASVEIPFTNDGCSVSTSSEYSLVNITQNSNSLGLTAVTKGSDNITIIAHKDGYIDKTYEIAVTVEYAPQSVAINRIFISVESYYYAVAFSRVNFWSGDKLLYEIGYSEGTNASFDGILYSTDPHDIVFNSDFKYDYYNDYDLISNYNTNDKYVRASVHAEHNYEGFPSYISRYTSDVTKNCYIPWFNSNGSYIIIDFSKPINISRLDFCGHAGVISDDLSETLKLGYVTRSKVTFENTVTKETIGTITIDNLTRTSKVSIFPAENRYVVSTITDTTPLEAFNTDTQYVEL